MMGVLLGVSTGTNSYFCLIHILYEVHGRGFNSPRPIERQDFENIGVFSLNLSRFDGFLFRCAILVCHFGSRRAYQISHAPIP
jgi:hypothetical protein